MGTLPAEQASILWISTAAFRETDVMVRIRVLVAAMALCAVTSTALAIWDVSDTGAWPKTWPKGLEHLRSQSSTIQGSELNLIIHHIPFKDRDAFEAAWPELLKVKTKGAPLVLVRSPGTHWHFGKTKAGVLVHSPPPGTKTTEPAKPRLGEEDVVMRWWHTTYIELVVDGDIVDLNRIPLPADTPIIDQRFKAETK
jgi:hypothetical protein